MWFTVKLLMSLFAVQPLVEYWLHRFVHAIRLPYHVAHHKNYGSGAYQSYAGDAVAWGIIAVLLVAGQPWWALAAFKYEITHLLSHIDASNEQHAHHRMHHRNPHCNYSFSVVWPDRLFGTSVTESAYTATTRVQT